MRLTFQRKSASKILNSGITLKIFTHVYGKFSKISLFFVCFLKKIMVNSDGKICSEKQIFSKIPNTFLFLFPNKMINDKQCWNSRNACQNSKYGRPWSDYFFRSSLMRVCPVCLGLFGRQLGFRNFRTSAVLYST